MSTARKPRTLHRLGLGTALLAAVAAPLALAVPAEAATTAHGCTVRPLKPFQNGTVGGVKQVRYDAVFSCAAGRSIDVQQTLFEKDNAPDVDDFYTTLVQSRNFPVTTVAQRGLTAPLQNTEAGSEEIYQRTRFRVSVNGGPVSAWTPYESGPVLSIAN